MVFLSNFQTSGVQANLPARVARLGSCQSVACGCYTAVKYGAIEVTPHIFLANLFSRDFFLFSEDFFLFSEDFFLFSGDFFLFVQHFCFLDFSYLGKTKINVVISNLCCSLKLKLFASLWVQDNGLLSRDNKTLSCENKKKCRAVQKNLK